MFIQKKYKNDVNEDVKQLISEFNDFTSIEDTNTAIFSNAANHIKQYLGSDHSNWVGFYLMDDYNNLTLGPFNGLPAVTYIENQKGVCGTCAYKQETILVNDVCAHPNHITCDINSRSEICIPVFKENKMIALLDIDSPNLNEFTKYKLLLESYVKNMEKFIK